MWCGEHTNDRISLYLVQQITRANAPTGRQRRQGERARRALLATLPEATPPPALPQQSTAEAIHLLDTQFPWLRGAER
jgi:hypothetical protein